MKKNHEQVESLICSAIAACGSDAVFSESKRYLLAALQSTRKVSQKRKRSAATETANKAAKEKHDQWWKMLKDNAAKNFNIENIDDKEE